MSTPRPFLALPLRTWLVLSHGLVLLLPVVTLVATGALAMDLRAQTRLDLENQATILAQLVEREVVHQAPGAANLSVLRLDDLGPVLGTLRDRTLSAIRVVDMDGLVVASSSGTLGEDLGDRPEVNRALAGRIGVTVRPRGAPSQRQPLSSRSRRARVRLFVASPVELHGEVVGAIVLSRTPREEVQALYQMAPRLALGAGLSLLVTVALAFFYGYLFSRSLRRLARVSEGIARQPAAAQAALEPLEASHVAEVAELATAVGSMTAQLRERLGYIGEFASHVSHEFKTPLATLRGTIELLQDDAQMDEAQRTLFLHNAHAEVQRLDQLVGGLLALARADQLEARDRVDLDQVIDEVIERHGLTPRSGTAGQALGDATQLSLVLENLVLNALEHGGQDVQVQIIGRDDGTRSGFDVCDNGKGISPNNLGKIFDRFFTTHRGGGGTGLGLALVQAIARAHRGSVTAQSEPGRTTFAVRLPKP